MSISILEEIKESLVNADKVKVIELTKQAIEKGIGADELLNKALSPGMEIVGQMFEKWEIFLPEMILSAEAMKGAVKILQPHLTRTDTSKIGKVIMATVEGDIHDIGPALVCMLLEGAGFEVTYLGVDVPTEKIVEVAKLEKPDIIGLSAFLNTTAVVMSDVINRLKEESMRDYVKVIIGGAAVNTEYSNKIGADGYGPNATAAVRLAKSLMKE